MIRRTAADGFLLIDQHEHGLLAGRLAARLGNARFAAPSPDAVEAVARHDAGWRSYDAAPTLDPDGVPRHTFEMPISTALQLWSASTRDAGAAAGPYAELLVSLHGLALSNFALPRDAAGAPDASAGRPARTPQEVFEINRFQHNQIELQERLRPALGLRTDQPLHFGLAPPGRAPHEDRLLADFRWLEAMDALSLVLCFGRELFPKTQGVFTEPGGRETPLHLNLDRDTLVVDPWPFATDAIAETVPARRVGARGFPTDDAYRAALRDAPIEQLPLHLRRQSP